MDRVLFRYGAGIALDPCLEWLTHRAVGVVKVLTRCSEWRV